jgi:hypothetical protein
MAVPQNVRRVKCYSGAGGIVYNYFIREVRKGRRGFHAGTEYIYIVAADRGDAFPLCVFVRKDATRKWSRRNGRELSSTEEYAAAKMRLFQAFDGEEPLGPGANTLIVDDSNLDALLSQLGI